MNDIIDHPFKPGAEVAVVVRNEWHSPHGFRKGIVAKVLKSGRFTLEGSPQQWRPHSPSRHENFWHASTTGSGELRIVDATTTDKIIEQNAKCRRYNRYINARKIIDREAFSDLVTDDVLEKIEAVVAALKPDLEVKK